MIHEREAVHIDVKRSMKEPKPRKLVLTDFCGVTLMHSSERMYGSAVRFRIGACVNLNATRSTETPKKRRATNFFVLIALQVKRCKGDASKMACEGCK